jgi:NAD-dependent DNA ligase
MVTREHMELLEQLGFGADIDSFEEYIEHLNDMNDAGTPEVEDNEYDALIALLREVKPDSYLLNQNWGTDKFEEDEGLLDRYPMRSIKTIMDYSELGNFIQACRNCADDEGKVTVNVSFKLNGHGIRLYYEYGKFKYARTRGRTGKGRDITRHALKAGAIEYVAEWKDIPKVEVRCEALIKVKDFKERYDGIYKHPLACVTHLVAESTPDSELEYLDLCCYKLLGVEGMESLSDEFDALERVGFNTPAYIKTRMPVSNIVGCVQLILDKFTGFENNGYTDYDTDGIVIAIDNREQFYSCDMDGNSSTGNVAIKMGERWATGYFESTIEEITWVPNKKYYTPKALIEPVQMPNGAEVRVVPLYNVGVMEQYGFYTGATIHFRFGGESGVTCCDKYGNNVTSRA